jgi:hypothetical protein
VKRYVFRVLLGLDQLCNAILGGDEDETLSSRLGKVKRRHGGEIPWRFWGGVPRVVDAFLEWIDPNHSLDAIEDDEGLP